MFEHQHHNEAVCHLNMHKPVNTPHARSFCPSHAALTMQDVSVAMLLPSTFLSCCAITKKLCKCKMKHSLHLQ